MSELRRYTAALRQRAARAEEFARWRAGVGQRLLALAVAPFRLIAAGLAARDSHTRDHLWTWLQVRTGEELLRGFAVAGLLTLVFLATFLFAEWRAELARLLASDSLYDRFVLFVLAVLALLGLLVVVDALRYRNWRRRMPFPVRGWHALVDQERFAYDVWWPCTLAVRLRGADPELSAGLRAALEYYCLMANRAYYMSDGPESRERWHVMEASASDVLSVRGHANNRVACRLYQLIRGPLRRLHTLSGALESVELTLHGEGIYISTPSSD